MSWPLSQDYNEAIQDPLANFSDPELRKGELATNALGLPLPRSGNFADVYEVRCPETGNKWAVKCFTRQVGDQANRYTQIGQHLEQAKLPFGVDFQYLIRGIRIRSTWYPVLKMRWVEGLLLNEFVREHVDKPVLLHALGQIWLRMSRRLREARIAHADLQHGNVILVPGRKMQSLAVKLIDYDGMFVPALAGKKSGEVGHPNYQHPQRLREGTYSGEVDRFPLLVVATALRALEMAGRGLWQRYDNGDNLLFKEPDLRDPATSALFGELRQTPDPLLRTMVGRLEQACRGKLGDAPLLEELIPEERGSKARGQAGEEANVWDFGDPEVVRRPAARRRKKGVPVWAWAAGTAAMVVMAAGGAYLATRPGPDTGASRPVVAQIQPPSASAPQPLANTGKDNPLPNPNDNPPSKPKDNPPPKPPMDTPPQPRDTPPVEPIDPDPPRDKPKPPKGTDPVGPPPKPPVTPMPAEVTYEKPSTWPPRLLQTLGPSDYRVAMTDGVNNWRLVNLESGQPFRKFVGHEAPVSCLAVSADRARALTGSWDRTVRLWNLHTGECLHVLRGHANSVTAVAISEDGSKGVSCDGGTTMLVWDLKEGKKALQVNANLPITALAISPDGGRAAVGVEDPGAGTPHPVAIITLERTPIPRRFPGHRDTVTCLAFSPDGTRLVSGGKDRAVRFWDANGGGEPAAAEDLPAVPVRLAFLPDGRRLVVELERGGIVLDGQTRGILARGSCPDGAAACYSVDEAGATLFSNITEPDKDFYRFSGKIGTETVVLKPPAPPAVTPRPKPPAPPPPPPRRKVERLPVPDAEAVAAARKRIKENFKDEYQKTDLRDRTSLAGRVSGYREDPNDSAVRYAALREAMDLYAEVGLLGPAMDRATDIASTFEVKPLQVKLDAFDLTVKREGRYVINPHPVDWAMRLFEQAKAEDDYELAYHIALTAERAAKRWKARGKLEQAGRAEADARAMMAEFLRIKKPLATLAGDPADAAANLEVGRFRCFVQESWEDGLPLLAKSSDAALRAAAEKELQDPDTAAGCKQVADVWYEQAKKAARGQQAAVYRHAAVWYWRAVEPGTSPQGEVKKQLTALSKVMPELGDPWFPMNISEVTYKGEYLRFDRFKMVATRHFYRGGIDVTVVARTTENNIRLTAGDGGRVIFNWEGTGGGTHVYRPDAGGRVDGRGGNGGSPMNPGNTDLELKPDTWYTLRWRMAPEGMKVWVDGKLVLEKDEPLDLSYPARVAVCSFTSPIDVKSMTVKGLGSVQPPRK
jgi:hypothetical protein